MVRTLALLLLACGCVCAQSVTVNLNILLERAYVRSNSNFGGGAVAMAVIAGPFSRNIVRMYVKKQTEAGIQTISDQQLKWGDNTQAFVADANSDVKLVLFVGGTRAGEADVGTLRLTDQAVQTYTVRLTESGSEIIGHQRPLTPQAAVAPVAAPAAAAAAQPDMEDLTERLRKLDTLKDAGVITDEEYASKRADILKEL